MSKKGFAPVSRVFTLFVVVVVVVLCFLCGADLRGSLLYLRSCA